MIEPIPAYNLNGQFWDHVKDKEIQSKRPTKREQSEVGKAKGTKQGQATSHQMWYGKAKEAKAMNRKLYRVTKPRKMVLGVCGGFADYFDLDPTTIRVAWAIASFFWGAGIILYIICALIMPQNPYV